LDDRLAPVDEAGKALGGVVQAHLSQFRNAQPPVGDQADARLLHVVVDAEAVSGAAFLFEPWIPDPSPGSTAGQGVEPVLPRRVSVDEGRLEAVGVYFMPPRAAAVLTSAAIALDLVPRLLNSWLCRDRNLDLLAGDILRDAGLDNGGNLVAPLLVCGDLGGQSVVERPSGRPCVPPQCLFLRGGGIERKPERPEDLLTRHNHHSSRYDDTFAQELHEMRLPLPRVNRVPIAEIPLVRRHDVDAHRHDPTAKAGGLQLLPAHRM